MKSGTQLLDHVTKSMDITRDLADAQVFAFMPNGEIYHLSRMVVRAGMVATPVNEELREFIGQKLRAQPRKP